MAISKIWNGSSWVTGIIKVFNGSIWVEKPSFWNGSAWVELYESCAAALCTVITIAHMPNVYTWWTWHSASDSYDAWGFELGADYYGLLGNNAGAIANDTYTDGSSTSRKITSMMWVQSQYLYFTLDTTSVPDTDNTFVSIDINGNNYTRAGAGGYVASQDGGTHWWWAVASRPFGTSGDIDFKVNI